MTKFIKLALIALLPLAVGGASAQTAAVRAGLDALRASTTPSSVLTALQALADLDYSDVPSDLWLEVVSAVDSRVGRGGPPQIGNAAVALVNNYPDIRDQNSRTWRETTSLLNGIGDCAYFDEATFVGMLATATALGMDVRGDCGSRFWSNDRRFEVFDHLIRGGDARVSPVLAAESLAQALYEDYHSGAVDLDQMLRILEVYEALLVYRDDSIEQSVASHLAKITTGAAGNRFHPVAMRASLVFKREWVSGVVERVERRLGDTRQPFGRPQMDAIGTLLIGVFDPVNLLWMAPDIGRLPSTQAMIRLLESLPGSESVYDGVQSVRTSPKRMTQSDWDRAKQAAAELSDNERDQLVVIWEPVISRFVVEYPHTYHRPAVANLFELVLPFAGQYADDLTILMGD